MPTPERGRIVLAEVSDPQRRNPKCRPLVIISATENIKPGEPILTVAVTGTFNRPLDSDCVELPWHRDGRVQTELRMPCVAKCSWQQTIQQANIKAYKGLVPAKAMLAILKTTEALAQQQIDK